MVNTAETPQENQTLIEQQNVVSNSVMQMHEASVGPNANTTEAFNAMSDIEGVYQNNPKVMLELEITPRAYFALKDKPVMNRERPRCFTAKTGERISYHLSVDPYVDPSSTAEEDQSALVIFAFSGGDLNTPRFVFREHRNTQELNADISDDASILPDNILNITLKLQTVGSKKYQMRDLNRVMHSRRITRNIWQEGRKRVNMYGKDVDNLTIRSINLAEKMQGEHRDWFDEKLRMLDGYLDELPPEIARGNFEHGLSLALKQEYKIRSEGLRPIEMADEELRDLITAYATDFYQILKFGKQKGLSATRALKLAERASFISPYQMRGIHDEYREIRPGFITRVLSNNLDPELALDKIRNNIERLTRLHPDLSPSTIMYAAGHHPDKADEFLSFRKEEIARLEILFPEMNIYLISTAVDERPKDTEGMLRGVASAIENFVPLFPDLSKATIGHAAMFSRKNVYKFLEKVREVKQKLRGQYPEFPKSLIESIAVHFSTDPEKAIKRAITLVENFTPLFPEFSRSSLLSVAVLRPVSGEAFLLQSRERFNDFQKKYPDVIPSIVKMAVLYKIDAEDFLTRTSESIRRIAPLYARVYPEMPKYMLNLAVVHRPANPESWLNEMLVKIRTLKEQYPDLPTSFVHSIAIRKEETIQKKISEYKKGQTNIDENGLLEEEVSNIFDLNIS